MSDRIRHCVECPECCTRYLIGFSPYSNGSCLISVLSNSLEEYQLFCACCRPPVYSRWKRSELKRYGVSSRAHARGYGHSDEIWSLRERSDQDMSALNRSVFGVFGGKGG